MINKFIGVLVLLFVLFGCVSAIDASANDTVDNVISEHVDYNELISVNDGAYESDFILCNHENLNKLSVTGENHILTSDDDEDDDEDEDEDEELCDEDINYYIEDIQLSNSKDYFNFFKTLMNKGFEFNLESMEKEGYSIFASKNCDFKVYGNKFTILKGQSYFVPTSERPEYNLGIYYPDTFYCRNNQVYVDLLYLEYQNALNPLQEAFLTYKNSNENFGDKFDLRNVNQKNFVTPIKDQKNEGTCWAFAAIGGLESHLLFTENKSYDFSENFDFSENNLKNVMSSIGSLGYDSDIKSGGSIFMSIAYFLRWSGPILDKHDPYSSYQPLEFLKPIKHVQGIEFIHQRNSPKDNNEIKKAIKNYGGVVTSIYWDPDNFAKGNNYFTDINYDVKSIPSIANHEIVIIGWDENYPAKNFKNTPKGNGAFIIKNSWGTKNDKGIYYVSYYDTALATSKSPFVGFYFTDVEESTNYGTNYDYTPLGFNYFKKIDEKNTIFSNKWTANKDDSLEACGFYNLIKSNCEINVYVNGNIKGKTVKKTFNEAGYHTVKFSEPIDIKKGQTFEIRVTLTNNNGNFNYVALEKKLGGASKATAEPDQSFIYMKKDNKYEWVDICSEDNANICLNAYTKYVDLTDTKIDAINNLDVVYGNSKVLTATLKDINNNPLKKQKVLLIINGVVSVVTTDNNGRISFNVHSINDIAKYDVNIYYSGNDVYDSCEKTITINIKQIPTILTLTTKKYTYPDKYIKFNLKTKNGKAVSSTVIIKVNGKTYYSKTNAKGEGSFKTNKKNFKLNKKVDVIFNGDNNHASSPSKSITVEKFKLKLSGVKSSISHKKEMSLSLNIKKNLKIKVKINGKNHAKIKFKNGKKDINLKKAYNLDKNNKYTFEFHREGNYVLDAIEQKIKIT